MTISFGKQKIDVRPWGGEGSGKALLMTRDPQAKAAMASQVHMFPNAFETLTDVPVNEMSDEDYDEFNPLEYDGLLSVVAKTDTVELYFNLEKMCAGLCIVEDEEEEEEETC